MQLLFKFKNSLFQASVTIAIIYLMADKENKSAFIIKYVSISFNKFILKNLVKKINLSLKVSIVKLSS